MPTKRFFRSADKHAKELESKRKYRRKKRDEVLKRLEPLISELEKYEATSLVLSRKVDAYLANPIPNSKQVAEYGANQIDFVEDSNECHSINLVTNTGAHLVVSLPRNK